jgi:hypothetical protein
MSGGGGGPIIIRSLAINDPTHLGDARISKLRAIADRARAGASLTLWQKLFVAHAALRSLRR